MQIVSYQMEQKRIKENSRSEQIGILSASLSRRMPKPLGQLAIIAALWRKLLRSTKQRKLHTISCKNTQWNALPQETHKSYLSPIYKGFGQPTSHIMFQLKFRKEGKNRIGEMLFRIKPKVEKSKTTNICTYSCYFKTTLRARRLINGQ